jgi:hypothetical protein
VFTIIEVPLDAGQMLEPMGTKKKFWYKHEIWGDVLFKEAREGTGEDWSEKIASELCQFLGIPHARYELAIWNDRRGIITPAVTAKGERLVHGNELLIETDPDYASKSAHYRTPAHTVAAISEVLTRRNVAAPEMNSLPSNLQDGLDVFVGYMLLDALIGNSDRHHENWGVIIPSLDQGIERLSPTFDHASCLGRNEPEVRLIERLSTRDRGFTVEAYADRCLSAIFGEVNDPKPLSPLEAFRRFSEIRRDAARHWVQQIELVQDGMLRILLESIPQERMSKDAKEFVTRMLIHNRQRLIEVCQ